LVSGASQCMHDIKVPLMEMSSPKYDSDDVALAPIMNRDLRPTSPTAAARYGAMATVVLAVALLAVMAYALREYVAAPTVSLLTWATFALHPLLMTLAFGFLAPIGVITWRGVEDMLGVSHSIAKVIHGVLMGCAATTGVVGVIDMWVVHERGAAASLAKGWAIHFQSAHGFIGIVALALFVLNWLGGLGYFGASIASHRTRREYKPKHVFLGATAILLTIVTVITGIISLAGRGDNAAPKDVLLKVAALLAALLLPAIALVFTYSKA